MIVRIMGEGQYRVADARLARLNRLDDQVVAAVAGGHETRFRAAYEKMLAFVRQNGTLLTATDLVASDVVLPFPNLTLEEGRAVFVGRGLIP